MGQLHFPDSQAVDVGTRLRVKSCRYLDKVLFDKLPSVMTQILGLFSVKIHRKTDGKEIKDLPPTIGFLVQQNVATFRP
eukprot:725625-Amphidinium_carterae.1